MKPIPLSAALLSTIEKLKSAMHERLAAQVAELQQHANQLLSVQLSAILTAAWTIHDVSDNYVFSEDMTSLIPAGPQPVPPPQQ